MSDEQRELLLKAQQSIATWKLRIGNLRVYYDIEEEPDQIVPL